MLDDDILHCLLSFVLSFYGFVTHSGGTEGEGEPEEPFLPEFQAAAKKCNYVKVREYDFTSMLKG